VAWTSFARADGAPLRGRLYGAPQHINAAARDMSVRCRCLCRLHAVPLPSPACCPSPVWFSGSRTAGGARRTTLRARARTRCQRRSWAGETVARMACDTGARAGAPEQMFKLRGVVVHIARHFCINLPSGQHPACGRKTPALCCAHLLTCRRWTFVMDDQRQPAPSSSRAAHFGGACLRHTHLHPSTTPLPRANSIIPARFSRTSALRL